MALDRLRFADIEKWGNLVKAWAKGEKARPTTLQEFKDQCVNEGVGASVPSYITDFEMVQAPDPSKLLLRLPPAALVKDTEEALAAGAAYSLPDFYRSFFNNQSPNMPPDLPGKLKVHAERIGDYTMSFCA